MVQRQFHAPAPNQLWVAEITYVRTTSGWCDTAFVINAFSGRIAGWATRTNLSAEALLLEALEQALIAAKGRALDGLVHHSDRGCQYVSVRYTEHLAQTRIAASVGSRGDACDNALAETINGLYKTELIHARPAWPSVTEVEFATMQWVHWQNNHRPHESPSYRTPDKGRTGLPPDQRAGHSTHITTETKPSTVHCQPTPDQPPRTPTHDSNLFEHRTITTAPETP